MKATGMHLQTDEKPKPSSGSAKKEMMIRQLHMMRVTMACSEKPEAS